MPQLSLPSVLTIFAVFVAAGVGVSVLAVSAANAEETCDFPVASGSASSLVEVQGQRGTIPSISFPTPLVTSDRELTLISEGTGEPVREGGYIDFDVSVFAGVDQQLLTSSSYDSASPVRRVIASAGEDFFGSLLECQRPGSRVVITTTVGDVFGPVSENELLQMDSTVVLVADIHQTYPQRAMGDPRLPQSGLPTVVQAPGGEHGLSFPNGPIAEELRVSVLKKGAGVPVAEGDFVTATFTGAVWDTRTIFISSFEQGIPLSLVAIDITTSEDGRGVVPGLATALIGQTVGSQVLVSLPPGLGYPPGSAPPGVPEGTTLVYVFDILGVTN